MKKMMILFLWIGFAFHANAQDEAKLAVVKMNQCLSGFSADQAQPLSFFSISGMLEQKQPNLIQRIGVASVAKIQVEVSKIGYSVTLTCGGQDPCINLVKTDMSTSTMGSTTFFFNNPGAANTFAMQCQKLIAKVKKADVAGELILYKKENGETPFLPDQDPSLAIASSPKTSEPKPSTNTTSNPKEKTIREIQEEDADDEESEVEKGKKSKPAKTKQSKEDREEKEEEENNVNTKSKKKSKTSETLDEENEDETPKTKSTTKKRANTEDNDLALDDEQKGNKDFCEQLMSLVKSGLSTQFKDIEGKETNSEKKINESKIKFKGARKSYLSWFNQKRAFLAELKLVDDNDYAVEEFQNIQNQLDECLAGWDDEDHSTDDIYESIKYEVKDVEYTDSKNPNSPSIRLIIASEGKKFIVFLRIQ
jgi:hypothetical protein